MNKIRIAFASDHAGFKLKNYLIEKLKSQNYLIHDFGCKNEESCDYPDFAHKLAQSIDKNEYDFGIAICGSGNGINMTINKYSSIRGALCWNTEIAKLARLHNNANICSLPSRFISELEAYNIVNEFISTNFEGGRHQMRIDKIAIKNVVHDE